MHFEGEENAFKRKCAKDCVKRMCLLGVTAVTNWIILVKEM